MAKGLHANARSWSRRSAANLNGQSEVVCCDHEALQRLPDFDFEDSQEQQVRNASFVIAGGFHKVADRIPL